MGAGRSGGGAGGAAPEERPPAPRPGEPDPGEPDLGEPGPLVLLVHGDGWETRFQVSSLAASAVAAGRPVDLCLFFAALACWSGERWDEPPGSPAPPAAPASPAAPAPPATAPTRSVTAGRLEALGFPPLSSLLASGRQEGLLRIHGCSASVRLLDLPASQVQRTVDTLSGWPTFHRLIERAGRVVTF